VPNRIKDILIKFKKSKNSPENLCDKLISLYSEIQDIGSRFDGFLDDEQDQQENLKYSDLIKDIFDIRAIKEIRNIILSELDENYKKTLDLDSVNSDSIVEKLRQTLIFTIVLSELEITKNIILESKTASEDISIDEVEEEKITPNESESESESEGVESLVIDSNIDSNNDRNLNKQNSLGFFKGQQVEMKNISLINNNISGADDISYRPGLYLQSWIKQLARNLLNFNVSVVIYSNFKVLESPKINYLSELLLSNLSTINDYIKIAMSVDLNSDENNQGLTQDDFLCNLVSTLGTKLEQDLFLYYNEVNKLLSPAEHDLSPNSKKTKIDLNLVKRIKKYPFVLLTELLNEVVSLFPEEQKLELNIFDIDKCKALARSKNGFTDNLSEDVSVLIKKSEIAVIGFISNLVSFVFSSSSTLSLALENIKQDFSKSFDSIESDFIKNNNNTLQKLVVNDFKTIESLVRFKLSKINENNLNIIPSLFKEISLPYWLEDLNLDLEKSNNINNIFNSKKTNGIKIKLENNSELVNNTHKHIFILLDLSGSMGKSLVLENGCESSRIEELKKALDATLSRLEGNDVSLSIIGFNRSFVDLTNGFVHISDINADKKSLILNACIAGGSTEFNSAFDFMCEQIKSLGDKYDPNKTICLTITDGSFNNGLRESYRDKLQNSAALDDNAAVPLFCSIAISDQANKNQLKNMMSGFFKEETSLAQNLYRKLKTNSKADQNVDLSHIQDIYDLFIISDGADKLDFYLSKVLLPFVNLEYPEVNINLDLNILYDKYNLSLCEKFNKNSGEDYLQISLRQQDLSDLKLLSTYQEFNDNPQAKGNIDLTIRFIPTVSLDLKDACDIFIEKAAGVQDLLEKHIKNSSDIRSNFLNNIKSNLDIEIDDLKLPVKTRMFGAGAGAGAGGSANPRRMPVMGRRSSTQATPSMGSISLFSESIADVAYSQSQSLANQF